MDSCSISVNFLLHVFRLINPAGGHGGEVNPTPGGEGGREHDPEEGGRGISSLGSKGEVKQNSFGLLNRN